MAPEARSESAPAARRTSVCRNAACTQLDSPSGGAIEMLTVGLFDVKREMQLAPEMRAYLNPPAVKFQVV